MFILVFVRVCPRGLVRVPVCLVVLMRNCLFPIAAVWVCVCERACLRVFVFVCVCVCVCLCVL